MNHVVTEIGGDGLVEYMKVQNTVTGEITQINADEEDNLLLASLDLLATCHKQIYLKA